MQTERYLRLKPLLLALCLTVLGGMTAVRAAVNMAVVAKPSTSYVSGDTSVSALNDGREPTRSRDRRRGSYGNWPRTGTQWVQYDWPRPISSNKIQVYWWDDRRGVRLPAAARLLYWDGGAFAPVLTDRALGVIEDEYNVLSFPEVTTSRLRLEIDGNEGFSTGILEWQVFDSGKSPAFPPDVHTAEDRVVVLGGRTYLNGQIKTLEGKGTDPIKTTWTKASGTGWVNFADPHVLDTTASFSQVGDYVLQLNATQGELSGSDTLKVQVVEGPPAENLHPVDTMPYQITSPLWTKRAKAIIVGWLPHCIEKINDPNLREGGINNFVDAAQALRGEALPEGHGHRGYVFSNAWVHQTVESMCIALMVDPQGDPDIIQAQRLFRKTLDDWVPQILAAQEPDGYLQTAYAMRRVRARGRGEQPGYDYDDGPFERWSARRRGDHEGYVAGYFLESAINHYMLTGGQDLRLYKAAKRLGDCWAAHIGPPPKQAWYDGHQAMEMALVRFGRFVNTVEGAGKGDTYIHLSKFLLDCRKDGSKYDQSHVPCIHQYEAVGHAVRASYNYAGMSDVAMETHDPDYQSAVISLYDNMINRKYYVTGGIGSGETSEGFGPDYSLRHNAYCEACSSCGLIFFEHKLNMAYHDARFADLYEETLYNALLGSLDLEGQNFYYQNPLITRRSRYPWHGCPCCVGNIPRVLLMLPTWTYVKDAQNLYVNLFIGSKVTVPGIAGTEVEMIQETDYPWFGAVSITVNPKEAKAFAIRIRVPNREVSDLYSNTPQANGISSIMVNGKLIQPTVRKGYVIIRRTWQRGDRIDLDLPLQVQRIKGSDKIEATRGQVALRYGPLIYSAEAVDQDLDKVLSPDAPLTAEWRPALLEGVMVIKGAWADGSEFMAVPNYARANRPGRDGKVNSTVWLKDE